MIRGVLFDLDDTLFDHAGCARDALRALRDAHAALQAKPFDELERIHARLLERIHARVMLGALPLDEARETRFRELLAACGETAAPDAARRAASAYRDTYQQNRRAVAGAARLLRRLRGHVRIAIVSNNLRAEQQDKLAHCGLDGLVDALVVSEQAGVAKPDPAIFQMALQEIDVPADEAVMVGDSWAADVEGAWAAGIRAVWFNPAGLPPPPHPEGVRVLRALQPVDDAIGCLLGGWSAPGDRQPGEPTLEADGRCG